MDHWILDSGGGAASLDAADAARLVAGIGSPEPAALAGAILALARRASEVHCCTVFGFEAERGPRLLSAASRGDTWPVFRAAARYTREFSTHDGLHALLRTPVAVLPPARAGTLPARLLLQRQRGTELAHAGYREVCYDSQGISERLAVLVRVAERCWIATHLYRCASAPAFGDSELRALEGLAPLFAAGAARHYAIDTDGEAGYRGTITADIGALCPTLTVREREVLLRLLDGLTTERIAADLAIRPTTVVTYRTRAYEKIGVRSRRELFARVLRRHGHSHALC